MWRKGTICGRIVRDGLADEMTFESRDLKAMWISKEKVFYIEGIANAKASWLQ